MPKISERQLRKIIAEELQAVNENVDHVAIKDVVSQAADMITALTEFKDEASPAMMNAVTPHLAGLEKALQDMISTPGSYVTAPKKEPKIVSLRKTDKPTKD
jgi:hypothetical protein